MSDFVVHKLNIKLLNNIDASLNTESDPIDIQSISLYCVHVSWSGFSAVNPVITVSASNSLSEPFVQVDSFIPVGPTGGRLLNVEKAGYAYVKISYSADSGAGSITASINGKVA